MIHFFPDENVLFEKHTFVFQFFDFEKRRQSSGNDTQKNFLKNKKQRNEKKKFFFVCFLLREGKRGKTKKRRSKSKTKKRKTKSREYKRKKKGCCFDIHQKRKKQFIEN
jgi:hypothetical protein